MKPVIIFSIISILLFSCREGIIEPEILVEKVNDPVQINERDSYTFLLNADSFSMNLTVFPSINSSTSRINITLIDYRSGYAKITLKDYEDRERYSYLAAGNVELYSELIDGYIPETVNIRTENFSGKIKINLREIF